MLIRWFERHNKISWLVTVLIAIAIFYISSITFAPSDVPRFPWKSVAYHFFAFFFLSFFLLISLIQGKMQNPNLIWTGVIISVLYAISDEIHQIFVPERCFAVSDILTNSAGILLAGILLAGILYGLSFVNINKNLNQDSDIKKAVKKK